MAKQKYTDEYLLGKLKELWHKYGKIQNTLIDKEPNFPTRKCYVRAFGSLENAYKLIGYSDYKKHKFTIEDAQIVLNERNGHFDLLTFNGMRNKAYVKCRECGDIFQTVPDSLLRDKTNESYGCRNCNKKRLLNKLNNNNLEFIEYVGNDKYKVKCLKCDCIIISDKSNLTNPKYNCQNCGPQIKNNKILNNKDIYKDRTIKRAEFIEHLYKISNEESLMWFYFLGLLFSDGHFDKESQRISLWVKETDFSIIDNIADFLHCKSLRYNSFAGIDFCGSYVFDDLINKYNIDNRKTYNPCDISSIKNEQLIAFIIGFIDGDGSILQRADTKQYKINIKLHLSWKDNLQYLSNCLYEYFNEENIPHTHNIHQPQGIYTEISWGNKNVLKGLAEFIVNNDIPVLKRKWDGLIERMVV